MNAFKNTRTLKGALLSPNWAVLTATRESVGGPSHSENVRANDLLATVLRLMGFKFTRLTGCYKGVDQGPSFLVTGIDASKALLLGKYFGQESVLVPAGLLFQDCTLNPVKPDETVVGKPAESKDFFSRISGGPAFSVGLDFSKRINLKSLKV